MAFRKSSPPDLLPNFPMPQLAELSPEMKQLAEKLIAAGPVNLLSVFAYILEHTSQNPEWNQTMSEATQLSMMPEGMPIPLDAALDDGLIYKVKITLKGCRPAVFREVEVPNMTLGELSEIIQAAMGWEGYHLHAFKIGRNTYGPILPDDPFSSWEDEEHVVLSQLVDEDARKFVYEYDFGDGWGHDILISKPKPPADGVFYPRCIKGELACPPEDCGGVWGYQEICDTLNLPADQWDDDQRERMEWLGPYDPQAFSIDDVNSALRKMYAPEPKPKKSKSKSKKKK